MEDMVFGVLLGGFAVTVLNYIGIFLFLELHDYLEHEREEK